MATGKCQWRETDRPIGEISSKYSTCSPDLSTCPDTICDPLEMLTMENNYYTCLQDCVDKKNIIFGRANSVRGLISSSAPCKCFSTGSCSCGSPNGDSGKKNNPKKDRSYKSVTNQTMMEQYGTIQLNSSSESPVEFNDNSMQCGITCTIVLTASPMILISIIILIIMVRQSKSKKYLKSAEFQEQINLARMSNDTEVLNVEIPLTSTFKFDVC